MYKMIYMGTVVPQLVDSIAHFKKIQTIGYLLDSGLSEKEVHFNEETLNKFSKRLYSLDAIPQLKPDLIFLCAYTKLLNTELIHQYKFINIHAGVLPKWRGSNANCWAIINGESKVGYTIHRVREGLDDGEIYRIIDVELRDNESYQSARKRIQEKLCTQLEDIFLGIIDGTIPGEKQDVHEVIYCTKFRNTDGDIHDWDKSTDYFVGLFRVMASVYGGTGLRLWIKGKVYNILDMEKGEKIGGAIGIPGAVLNCYKDGSVLIKTRDTAVKINCLVDVSGLRIFPCEVLKIGMRI